MKRYFILLGVLTITSFGLANYCNVCKDHTMCKYQDVGPSCGSASESGVSSAEAKEIVRIHNAFRSKIAQGQEQLGAPGPQPAAADMNAFVWDDKLAEVAQRWANQCTFQHDKCRNDPRFKVGQNIYWSSGLSQVDWNRAISAWYGEVSKFDGRTTNSFRFSEWTGHYSQMVWGKTKYIGCARTTYGGAYRLLGYTPKEYMLSAISSEGNNTQQPQKVKRQSNVGYFGGLQFNPAGAEGALGQISGSDYQQSEQQQQQSSRPGMNPSPIWPGAGGYYPSTAYSPFLPSNLGFFDGANDNDGPRPYQNPIEYKLPTYLELLHESNKLTHNTNQVLNNSPQKISSHKWLSNEWMPVNYEFTGRDQILICNYGPAGNYQGQPVYTPGTACSMCPKGTQCVNGLCA